MKRTLAIILIGVSVLFTVALIIATNKKQETTEPKIEAESEGQIPNQLTMDL